MRRPFQIKGRKGWHAEYKFADGVVQRATFDDDASAATWLEAKEKEDIAEQGPLLGGPERVTLGQFLGEYAFRITMAKAGYKNEIDRINHYVTAAGLPRLRVEHEANGNRTLVKVTDSKELPSAFRAHLDARMAQRSKTYAWIGKLARMKVSKVTIEDIRELMTTGTTERWSHSTIQKEVALLKAAFNTAIAEWRWHAFTNPCIGLKLKKSNSRFVVVTQEQMQRLSTALAECDNAEFWPLVDLAMHTLMREDSLLSMRWSQTDLETRRARVWGKGNWHDAHLPQRAVDVLRALPRTDDDRIFTMTANAVNMAWEGVREKARLPGLTFRDLRHVGATAYAKAGMSAHALKNLLCHTTTRMAEVYVNLARSDVTAALEALQEKMSALSPMPPPSHAHGKKKHPRLRKPPPQSNVFHLVVAKGRLRAVRPENEEVGVDVGPATAPKRALRGV